jgi:hypothetical protein
MSSSRGGLEVVTPMQESDGQIAQVRELFGLFQEEAPNSSRLATKSTALVE